jgi:hypothetical protein
VLIGCLGGLTVRLPSLSATDTAVVSVQASTEAEPRIFNCPGNRGATMCENFFPQYLPGQVTIKVTISGTVTSLTVEPRYRDIRYGGCTTCRGGTVEVPL